MKGLICILSFYIFTNAYSQNTDTWYSFDEGTEHPYLRGYKDAEGNVRIAPKFSGFTMAERFEHIIAVTEATDKKWDNYYLLKNGTEIGRDSLYVTDDNMTDCESEGYIRFSVDNNERMGVFDHNGKIAIPPTYNAISAFKNGVAFALKGGQKIHLSHDHSGCDHWYWGGGTNYLINTKNEILIKNFKPDEAIDYYSMQISAKESTDKTRVNFKGVNGNYYSFVNNRKFFEKFITEELIKKLSPQNLIANSYHKLIFWNENDGWISRDRTSVINENYKLISETLNSMMDSNMEHRIVFQDFIINPDDMDAELDKYNDNCGALDNARYPSIEILIQEKGDYSFQKSLTFLKTEDGFKLLSLSLGSELK